MLYRSSSSFAAKISSSSCDDQSARTSSDDQPPTAAISSRSVRSCDPCPAPPPIAPFPAPRRSPKRRPVRRAIAPAHCSPPTGPMCHLSGSAISFSSEKSVPASPTFQRSSMCEVAAASMASLAACRYARCASCSSSGASRASARSSSDFFKVPLKFATTWPTPASTAVPAVSPNRSNTACSHSVRRITLGAVLGGLVPCEGGGLANVADGSSPSCWQANSSK
mmetsp:Transcript_22378/g.56771  ORF Transcript_22378/g.56771 Transcript_22378/m.56771 type:complete len:223 (-) Transcript_22378:1461-2129(-)